MTNARERAIKMYWKMAKEKCPFQTEEIVNGYLEGFIDCAEYLLLQNTDIEKENAELKGEADSVLDNWCRGNDPCPHLKKRDEQLTKAKKLLTRFVMASVYFNGKETDLVEEAEQFLKEE